MNLTKRVRVSIDQNDCFTRPENEASHGKAVFFLGNEPQNSNFVRFGGRLDKVLSQFQSIEDDNKLLNRSYNKLMNNRLQIIRFNQAYKSLSSAILFEIEDFSILQFLVSAITFNKKIQNKEV